MGWRHASIVGWAIIDGFRHISQSLTAQNVERLSKEERGQPPVQIMTFFAYRVIIHGSVQYYEKDLLLLYYMYNIICTL